MAAEAWAAAVGGLGEAPGKQRCKAPLSPDSGPVCVTGITGFIALHLARQLLEKGYTVKGTLRSEGNEAKMAPVRVLQDEFGEKLTIASGVDCLKAESFDAAVVGCAGVFHTASPFFFNSEDPMKELVEPAKLGTQSCLEACQRAGCVKRVIVTSSCAAIFNMGQFPFDYNYTAKDWNLCSCPDDAGKFPEPSGVNAYRYSKAVAEKCAWDFTAADDCAFDVACVNPPMVVGKNYNKPASVEDLNTSSATVLKILRGQQAPNPNSVGWVSVADVARAHIVAYEHPEAGGRRFVCAADVVPLWTEVAAMLKELKPDCPVVCDAPATGEGVRLGLDNSPLKALGMPFTPLREALRAQCESLAEAGFLSGYQADTLESSGAKLDAALEGAVEMKVTLKKPKGFYIGAALSFLKGVDAKAATEDTEAVAAKPAVDAIRITGLGEACNVALAAAAAVESEGAGAIVRMQTNYPSISGRPCAQVLIDVKRK